MYSLIDDGYECAVFKFQTMEKKRCVLNVAIRAAANE